MDSTTQLARAAQAGDRQALERLLAEHLPLIYNVVGRALNGHPDVDDVVQETMLRAVQAIRRLREPERFRSWLVAIAIRQVQERGRARGTALARQRPLEEWPEPADPDFVDDAIVGLSLSSERREVATATRWLAPADRQLLALWWQEVGGVLTRSELAAALGVSQPHAAVRIQRVKAQLDLARSVVRAWRAVPRCAGLSAAGRDWDGRSGPAALKPLGRHVRGCEQCRSAAGPLVPTEHLLVGAALLPVPAVLAAKIGALVGTGAATVGGAHAAPAIAVAGVRRSLGYLNLKTAILGGSTLAGAVTALVFAVYYQPVQAPDNAIGLPSAPVSAIASAGGGSAGPSPGRSVPAAVAAAPMTGVAVADLYVAPDGSDDNPGTLAAPLATLGRAGALVQPGQTIALRGGAYRPTSPVTFTTNGTPTARITLSNYRDEQPVIDATAIRSNEWYITQRASYWTVQGIAVHASPTFPYVCVSCQHDVFRQLTISDNGATGLVLRGPNTVDNQVLDSDFHDNHDDAAHGANADGVAFKDGSGTGNVIRDCRAYHNADDGVDLSGFADPVTVAHNWAYGNGVNRWGLSDFAGAGTGFKLGGGDPIPNVAHVVADNAAWDNTSYGFTEQGNKGAIAVTGNTAYHNGSDGFAFWYSPSVLRSNLALRNGRDDNRGDTAQESENSWNEPGWGVAVLRGTDPATAEGPRQPDGSLPRTTFLTTTRPGVGATMTP